MRELLLFRHAHAQQDDSIADTQRELRDKGKRNAQRIGIWLARHDLLPDLVLTSAAIRAKRTAEKTCKAAGLNADVVITHMDLYQATVETLLQVLAQLPTTAHRVMLVGHNPSMEQLLAQLCSGAQVPAIKVNKLSPATLAYLKLDVEWHKIENTTAELVKMVYPKSLPRLFPFPDINATPSRTRPAYYYLQSSVVPYRYIDGNLQVLIITSSKNKHWVIPKGICDPGMTAQQSAAKEAYEEAGVHGEVLSEKIGYYQYPKWDAVCEVSVYPMRVDQLLENHQWQENHRQRQWVSVQQAVSQLKNPDIKSIVAMLPDWLEKNG